MFRPRRTAAVALATITVLVGVAALGAEEATPSCGNPRIVVDAGLDSKWQQAIEALCAELGSMRDVDPSARLRLTPSEERNLLIVASLSDGRTAERRVASPGDLRATVEALVTLPPSPERQKPPEPSTANGAPAKQVTKQPIPAQARQGTEKQAQPVAIEVGASAIGRVWGAPTYVSAGGNVYAGLRPGSWLFALLVRWDPLETLTGVAPPTFEMDSLGAGFVVARRFGTVPQFDLGATASLVEEMQSMEDTSGEIAGSQTDIRLGVLARTLFGRGAFRGNVSLEADVSPGRFRRTVRIDQALPDLPNWSVGFGVGATWEDR